ncbi:MAG TPA: PEP-CTERM sorting domain-containing protein [Burkholderiaceae bacterium]|jgi:hypothetical protein
MKKLLIPAFLVLPALALAGPVTANNLLTNGSFESDAQGAGSYSVKANLTGWTGGTHGIELRNGISGMAYDGKNFIELDTTANSSMSQSFSTTVGQSYLLSFVYEQRANNKGADSDGMSWSAGNMSDVAFGQDTITDWTSVNASFVATDTTTTLTFKALGTSDSIGTSLDAVSVVSAVPEPASYQLALLGLVACAVALRRRPR